MTTYSRPRVVEARVTRGRGWEAVVHVILERGGVEAEARKDAVGEEGVVFRCAAEATLQALHELLGPPERFALVGAKRVIAFDSAVVLTCVRTLTDRPRRLIGCVPIRDDPVVAIAHAILHAVNRVVEAVPDPSETEDTDRGDPAPDTPTDTPEERST